MNRTLVCSEKLAFGTARSMHCRFSCAPFTYTLQTLKDKGLQITLTGTCIQYFTKVVHTKKISLLAQKVVIKATARPKSTFVFTKTVPFCVSRKTRVTHRHSLSIAGHYDRVFTFDVVGSIQKLDYVE